jgi:hypothetical protein
MYRKPGQGQPWIRSVQLPPDARVHKESNRKWKADRVLLGPRIAWDDWLSAHLRSLRPRWYTIGVHSFTSLMLSRHPRFARLRLHNTGGLSQASLRPSRRLSFVWLRWRNTGRLSHTSLSI